MEDTASAVNSAPASSSSPSTFSEAFASDASPASGTSSQSNDATAAVQPATEGDGSPTPAGGDDRSSFIPRPRFDEVNAKYNELKAWREQHGWAEQVNRDQIAEISRIAQLYQTDKSAFVREIVGEDPSLVSEIARMLSSRRGQQTQPDLNGVVIDLGNGQTLSLGDLKQQWMQDVEQRLQPVMKTVEQVEAERQQLAAMQQANSFASSTVQEVTQYPGMDDPANRRAVAEAVKAMNLTTDDPRDLRLAVEKAWRGVVLPKLHSKAESRLLDNLQQKAAASTSMNPGSAAPSTSKAVKSFHDLPADAWS